MYYYCSDVILQGHRQEKLHFTVERVGSHIKLCDALGQLRKRHHAVVPNEKPRTKSPSVLYILILGTLTKSFTTIVTQVAQSRMGAAEDR